MVTKQLQAALCRHSTAFFISKSTLLGNHVHPKMSFQQKKKCEGLDLHVMHNDVISASAADYGDDFQSISISTILELSAGDTVWVKLSGEIYGDSSRFTTFQGHLQGDQKTYFNRAISGDVIHGCYKYLRLK